MKGEIYYTGGGIWCAWAKVGKHIYYGGSTDGGAYYRTKKEAIECSGEGIIGYPTNGINWLIWHRLLDEEKIAEGMCWYDEIIKMVDEGVK